MKLIKVENEHKNKFEAFVNGKPQVTCMQMWEWCNFRNELMPGLYNRLGVVDAQGDFHLTANYAIFKFKFFGKVIYIPQGPIWDSKEALGEFKKGIEKLGKENNCFLVICEPRVRKDDEEFEQLIKYNFKYTDKAVQPRVTVFLDLTKGEEELLKSFSKTTRYNIRYATRKGVTVTKYNSPKDIDRIIHFYELLQMTKKRRYFYVQPLNYFEKLWNEFSRNGHATLYEVTYKGDLLGSLIVLNNKIWAGSIFSGSSRKFTKLKANYLSRWESIRDAKAKGCKIYDFFGATKSREENHPFYHTTQFKLGFGRSVTEFAGTFEIILNQIKYNMWYALERFGLFKFYEDSFIKEFQRRNATSKEK